MTTYQALSIKLIRMDGGTQPRVALIESVVNEYMADMMAGASFPPVVVFYDGESYWLADGFHRTNAVIRCERETIDAEVKQGTRRDAILYSVGANGNHGQRRTNADKRRAVMLLLNDSEWGGWPQTKIAKCCRVSQQFVSKILSENIGLSYHNGKTGKLVERNGTTYTMNTANIGNSEPTVKSVAEHYGVTHASTVEALKRLYRSSKREGSSGTFEEIAATGWIQPTGDGDAVHISEEPRLIKFALEKKAALHRQMAASAEPIPIDFDEPADYLAAVWGNGNGKEQPKREPRPTPAAEPADVSPMLVHGLAEDTGLESESVDLIITSPPYNLGNDYWAMGGNGRLPKHGINYESYDDSLPHEAYVRWQYEVLQELWRVAKSGASLFYNHRVTTKDGELVYPLKWLDSEENPWVIRQEIIWDRGSTHNHNSLLFWPEEERVYWMTKGKPTLPNRPIGMSNVWRFHGPRAHDWHPVTFADELPKRCIEAVGRDGVTVLDPFCGSGTTLQVALSYGYKAIGIDKTEKYLDFSAIEHGWDCGQTN